MNKTEWSLRAEERQRIDEARNWIKGHWDTARDERYSLLEAKLFVVQAILDNGWAQPDETWKLQALGVAFGDALKQKLALEWVTVDDDYGCDPALKWPGTEVFSYPLTMISKRIERGEWIDVQELLVGTCTTLTEMALSRRYDTSAA